MSDRYSQLVNNPIGKFIAPKVGLPQPVELERYQEGQPVVTGPVLTGAAPGGRLESAIAAVLASAGAEVHSSAPAQSTQGEQKFKALVFDATGIKSSDQLMALRDFFQPVARRVLPNGRIIVLGTPPEACENPREATAQRALEGFTRSTGKEIKKGATSQLVYVAPGAEGNVESTLRFFLSPRSAYVSGQVVEIGEADVPEVNWERPLKGKVALVTGASRGIGEAMATVLAREGAHVVALDIPALSEDLDAVAQRLGGSAYTLDITADDAPGLLASYLAEQHGGVDIVVHNAGITRDKTLGNMKPEIWGSVINVNLSSEERINDELIAQKVIRENGRVICVSSIAGIAGNFGQTNYATSKAGVIGMVQSMAPVLAEQNVTINAVAPGFIETQMTAKIPLATREAGRRLNSMSQGGLPIDVAETVAWYANPASAGLTGNVVRVCGQMMLGA
jgi:3-oxoacyl-[acyl-carrier protein] reductase